MRRLPSPPGRSLPSLCLVAGFSGRGVGLFAVALALCLLGATASARALPAVGIFLEGEPEELGLGGEPFHDLRLEARRLRRPALLGADEGGFALLTIDAENTLNLKAERWAGTRAYERRISLQAYLPIGELLPGVRLAAFAAIEQRDARMELVRGGQSLFRLGQDRSFPLLGLRTSLPLGFHLAAGAEGTGGAARWLLEGSYRPSEALSLWLRHRDEGFRQTATVPRGAATRVHSPDLHMPLDFQRAETELGAAWRTPSLWAQGAYRPGETGAFWVEVGAKPWEPLALRLGADREGHRLSDRLAAGGTGAIATIDLRLERLRAFLGADWEVGPRDLLRARYELSRLRGDTWADELGTNAAQAFLHLDTDLGLLLEGGAAIQVQQLKVGWRRETAGDLRFALGAQYLRAHTLPSAISLVSFVLDRALAEESVERLTAHLLGVTAFVEVPVAGFRLAGGLGQLLPLAVVGERAAPGPAPGQPPPAGPRPGWFERLRETLRTTSGGTRLVFQASVDF